MTIESLIDTVQRGLQKASDVSEAVRATVEAVHASSSSYDWTGVYLMDGPSELVLSYYLGTPSPHVRIPLSEGICGAAARKRETIVVGDVCADARYLACSLETKSEIVVPILQADQLFGEIDIDSHTPHAFGPDDSRRLGQVAELLAEYLSRAEVTS